MNKKALHKLSSGLFLLSTKNGAQTNGCIINTVMQISSEPSCSLPPYQKIILPTIYF